MIDSSHKVFRKGSVMAVVLTSKRELPPSAESAMVFFEADPAYIVKDGMPTRGPWQSTGHSHWGIYAALFPLCRKNYPITSICNNKLLQLAMAQAPSQN